MNNILAYIEGKISVYEKQKLEHLGTAFYDKIKSDNAFKICKELNEIKDFIKNELINENS